MKIKWIITFACMLAVTTVVAQNNILLHKPIVASSVAAGHPATNMVDGIISRTSTWQAANGKAPHIIEIDLQQYYTIHEIRIHSGIMDREKKADEMTQAAGFWSVKNFKLQYWDDANWSDFPGSEIHENRLTTVAFTYEPAVTTFKIRLICDDGEPVSIMEMEAFGSVAANMPAPPTVSSSIQEQVVSTAPQSALLSVTNKVVGKSMKYVGYNQGYLLPGSNVTGWIEYAQVNSFRVWASLNSFVPETAVQVDPSLNTVAAFDQRKAALRKEPEHNQYIDWNQLLPIYSLMDTSSTNAMQYDYALSALKKLKVDIVLQVGSRDFDSTWENKWKQWQRYYALAYYSAKEGDVTMYAMQNEPNHRNSGPMKLDQWIMGMQITSDAIHCAVEDVNKKYGRHLVPKFVGPVTAGNNPEWWAAVAKNIRTDYHGKTVNKDLLEIFSTHSYNSPAVGYASRINNIRELLLENHPAHKPLPIVYTEIGRWMNAYLIDKEETMDSPSLFTEWAGIYANNMKNGGYGMWAFKFANTVSSTYPRGIKSGHHFIWQGQRIVEDAYKNLAAGKKVSASSNNRNAGFVTDGNKTDASAWIADTLDKQKWLIIELGKKNTLGGAVIYTGSAGGVYTSPDRIRNFKLQYAEGNDWKDIPGATESNNKYAQDFYTFDQPVTTDRVRLITTDEGACKVREIKLFAKGDGPGHATSYNVSGIQRTGEVVRLFAKGFKEERPLLETRASVEDSGLDHYTSYDEKSGNYCMWLVQRGLFDYHLTIDLGGLTVAAGSAVTAEIVNADYYGELVKVIPVTDSKKIELTLPAQSVILLSFPKNRISQQQISSAHDATAHGGNKKGLTTGNEKQLGVQLDAGEPENNQVSYVSFKLPAGFSGTAKKVILKVKGYTDKKENNFRLHVYGIPGASWTQETLNWSNAPLLDKNEALIKEVGEKAFVAGELSFADTVAVHMLDVTELVNKHGKGHISFVFVRETRQLGDDEDKGKKVMISSAESDDGPELIIWNDVKK